MPIQYKNEKIKLFQNHSTTFKIVVIGKSGAVTWRFTGKLYQNHEDMFKSFFISLKQSLVID